MRIVSLCIQRIPLHSNDSIANGADLRVISRLLIKYIHILRLKRTELVIHPRTNKYVQVAISKVCLKKLSVQQNK